MAHKRTSREGKVMIASTIYLEEKVDARYVRRSEKKYGKPNKSRLLVETLNKADDES